MNTKITIDGRLLEVESGITILEAARRNSIYIPTLCDYAYLSPHGSCRLCIVEIEGNPKTPASCTTPVEEDMVVRTDTPHLRYLRSELLHIMLSEHPASCLICTERDHCDDCMVTLRKVGVTTGCRSCSNDMHCEIQELAAKIGLTKDYYPVRYRKLPIERNDPFFDRDYNLCVYCARCIRVCEHLHLSGTLVYTHKGPDTVVNTAFGRSHLEAGCSFCGACVEVCPTGALSETANKWDGKPEKETLTTCPLCSLGCQMRILTKNGQVIGSLPAKLPGDGHLCVKGRFGIIELVSHPSRLVSAQRLVENRRLSVSWDEAIQLAIEKLAACPPEKFGLVISANCSNEELFVAQKFARLVMGSHRIGESTRGLYGPGFNPLINLVKKSLSIGELGKASDILCLGLDTKYALSVLEIELRQAKERRATIVTIHPEKHNLSNHVDQWLQPSPDEEVKLFELLVDLTTNTSANGEVGDLESIAGERIQSLAHSLMEAEYPVIVVGPFYLQHPHSKEILDLVRILAANTGAGVIVLPAQNNLLGSLLMGAYPELLPGGISSADAVNAATVRRIWKSLPDFKPEAHLSWEAPDSQLDVLYVIGEDYPSLESGNKRPFVIWQNIYPPENEADLILPAAAFTEADGTTINYEGRVLLSSQAISPPGQALPSWQILCRIAQAMGVTGFEYQNPADVQKGITKFIPGFQVGEKIDRSFISALIERQPVEIAVDRAPDRDGRTDWPFSLTIQVAKHTYLGFPLTQWIAGLRVLYPADVVCMHPQDARQLGVSNGEKVLVTAPSFERIWPVWFDVRQQRGTLYLILNHQDSIVAGMTPVDLRKAHVQTD